MKKQTQFKIIIPTLAALLTLSGCTTTDSGGGGGANSSLSVCPAKSGGFNDAQFCTAIHVHNTGRAPSAFMEVPSRWSKKTLKVKFLGGSPALQARVIKEARTWSKACGMKFDFGNHAQSDIRVAFQCDGHWSYVGRQNTSIPQNKATMNLQLGDNAPNGDLRRVVLHEFGHAIGLEHEHQHPEGRIPWNEAKVIQYYKETQGWTEAEIRYQVLNRNSSTNYVSSGFDKMSIMMYPTPAFLTDGRFTTGWNTALSSRDKSLVSRPDIYGGPAM